MARLDLFGGPAKELAQIAAAIGREFSHALLALVVRQPEAELRSTFDLLIAAGLLFRRGVPPHATYLFKHALVQDAAYGTLLRAPRRTLHAHIAETIESEFAASPRTSRGRLLHLSTMSSLWGGGRVVVRAVAKIVVAVAGIVTTIAPATAQNWPTRPLTIVYAATIS
jgi:hypothetical protein